MTPKDFETNYLSPAGAGFSIASFTQSWFRFHNKAEVDGLYFVGRTHPGAGLPGVGSAKVLDALLDMHQLSERADVVGNSFDNVC